MLWLPFAATAVYALSVVQRKLFLKHTRVPMQVFLPALLAAMSLMNLVAAPFDWSVDVTRAVSPVAILALLTIIVLNALWYEFLFRGTREESLSRYNLIALVEPMVVFALAAVAFPVERDPRIWLSGVIVVLALILGHRNHHKITFEHGERFVLVAVLLGAVIVVLQRFLVDIYSAAALNTIYNIGTLALLIARYGFGWLRQSRSMVLGIFVTAFLIFANELLYVYSLGSVGATITMFVFLLESVFIALAAFFLLGERLSPKLFIAGLVMLGTIAYTVALVVPN